MRKKKAAALKAAIYLGEHHLIEDPLFDDGYKASAPVYPVDPNLMKRVIVTYHSHFHSDIYVFNKMYYLKFEICSTSYIVS
jgi:hypothetical protein